MPKISVIVPVYNVEKYLGRCIDSILAQTFKDFELILVDDGSKDESGEICDIYASKDNRIKVIHKENAGVSCARNTGIEQADGEYIMFVDSDDFIDKEMLREMYDLAPADMIFSGLRYLKEDTTVMREESVSCFENISLNEFIEEYYIKFCITYNINGPVNKLYKKSVLNKNNIWFNVDISICEDGLFVTEVLKKCKYLSNKGKIYYNYVQYDGNNLMRKYNYNAIDACELLYLSKKDLICNYAKKGVRELTEYNDKELLKLFIGFLVQIYTRSGLSFFEKYKRMRESFKNNSFRKLIYQHRNNNLTIKALFITMKMRMHFVMHSLMFIRYR